MSRVAKAPIAIPSDVKVTLDKNKITVSGAKGQLEMDINPAVNVEIKDENITFQPNHGFVDGWAQSGTARALVNNMVFGISQGFEKKLKLIGVGYRAKVITEGIDLTLGFSHPLIHALPSGVSAECPSQTEIILRGIDKQLVGQVAAEIRNYRPPEPYKGKGIRYEDEQVRRKEAKKK